MREMTCIRCPLGCHMKVTKVKGEFLVTGNNCPRGKEYAISELTEPVRVVTSLITYNGNVYPVKTSIAIPKKMISKVLREIDNIKLDSKPKYHEAILKNILFTGADIIVTKV